MPLYKFEGVVIFHLRGIVMEGLSEDEAREKILENPAGCIYDDDDVETELNAEDVTEEWEDS